MPYSRQAFRAIERIQPQLNGGVRFAFRHFLLTEIHPHALAAAAAAEAAALQIRFWDMHELSSIARRSSKTTTCGPMQPSSNSTSHSSTGAGPAPGVLRRVGRDVESELVSCEVRGTPTPFIDGVVHVDGYDATTLLAALAR